MSIATRFTDLFGCRHPLQQAGIGRLATPGLAVAVAAAGGLGMLSATIGHDALAAQLDAVPRTRWSASTSWCRSSTRPRWRRPRREAPYVEFFWGAPDHGLVDVVHSEGARAGWQVGSAGEARAAQEAGCEVIVAQGIEAGGHVRGTVGLLPLLEEVRTAVTSR